MREPCAILLEEGNLSVHISSADLQGPLSSDYGRHFREGEANALCVAPVLNLQDSEEFYGRGNQCLVRCPILKTSKK